jgi:hypothetical protein
MVEIIVVLAIVGVILWFVNAYLPMAPPFKAAINIIAVICLIIWLLQIFGITHFNLPR